MRVGFGIFRLGGAGTVDFGCAGLTGTYFLSGISLRHISPFEGGEKWLISAYMSVLIKLYYIEGTGIFFRLRSLHPSLEEGK